MTQLWTHALTHRASLAQRITLGPRFTLRPTVAAIGIALTLGLSACGQVDDYLAQPSSATNGENSSSQSEDSPGEDSGGDSSNDDTPSGGVADPDGNARDNNAGDSSDTTEPADSNDPDAPQEPDTDDPENPASGPAQLSLTVVNTYPHDAGAFTQGLEYIDGALIESTGLYGTSGRRRVGLTNGEVSSSLALDDDLFGGGIALIGDETIIQLTWREGVAILADLVTLQEFDRFNYEGEGWGLCSDGERLVMSDGTSELTFRDPMSFNKIGSVKVTLAGEQLENINELECVGNDVWANIWLSSEIVRIDPTSGEVTAVVDASSLLPAGADSEDVLNGIAYNPETETFFLTGKRWDELFEVTFSDG